MYDECAILSMRFPQKLWRIVNECASGSIRWGANGATVLLDYKRFQEEYLDSRGSAFKTRNITSFVRQLNLYGFRKVTSHGRDPTCNSRNPDVHEFLHDSFRAGRPDLLVAVCRKTAAAAGRPAKCCQRGGARAARDCERFEGFDGFDGFGGFERPRRADGATRLQLCRIALGGRESADAAAGIAISVTRVTKLSRVSKVSRTSRLSKLSRLSNRFERFVRQTYAMSQLQTCRLALTKELEEISKEYHQKHAARPATNFLVNVSGTRETVSGTYGVEFYPIQNDRSDMTWVLKNAVLLPSRKATTDVDQCCNRCCISAVRDYNSCIHCTN